MFLEVVRKLFTRPVPITVGCLTGSKGAYSSTSCDHLSNRNVGEHFQRSDDTISKYEFPLSFSIHGSSLYVIDAQSKSWCCHHPHHSTRLMLNSPPNLPLWIHISPTIWNYSHSSKCTWSTGCISLFSMPPSSDQSAYHNCKGGVSQNVPAALQFAMHFCTSSCGMGGKSHQMGSFMMHLFMTWDPRWSTTSIYRYPLVMHFCAILWCAVSPPEWETSGLRYVWSDFLTYYNPWALGRLKITMHL